MWVAGTKSRPFVDRLLYRVKATAKILFRRGTPQVSTAWSPPISKLPQEIVEMIFSYFIHDTRTLLACSLTCYSWYIAAVSHLHYSLTTDIIYNAGREERRHLWPKPLKKSYELGLLHLAKRFQVRLDFNYQDYQFGPDQLSERTMRYFSALTNLQELRIDFLQVSSFMPNIQRYFGHLSPTLRSLALKRPNGSCRQILYFLGLFPNLQDFKLERDFAGNERENAADAALIPLSTPPLRGWLTLIRCTKGILLKDLITLFGGLRFRHMDLYGVSFVRVLLDACTRTLETLRLYPTDPCITGLAAFQLFNLSRHKSLRTLETTSKSISVSVHHNSTFGSVPNPSDFLKAVLSSIASPRPLDIVIIYRDVTEKGNPYCERRHLCRRRFWLLGQIMHEHCFQQQLRVLREMRSVRDFHLVLSVDPFGCTMDQVTQLMERMVKVEKAKGGFDFLSREPQMVYERRPPCTGAADCTAGGCTTWNFVVSCPHQEDEWRIW